MIKTTVSQNKNMARTLKIKQNDPAQQNMKLTYSECSRNTNYIQLT